MSVIAEIRRQIAILERDRRVPVELRVGPDEYRELLCHEGTLVVHDLAVWGCCRITTRGQSGVLVIPRDFRGYGQGMTRPAARRPVYQGAES